MGKFQAYMASLVQSSKTSGDNAVFTQILSENKERELSGSFCEVSTTLKLKHDKDIIGKK